MIHGYQFFLRFGFYSLERKPTHLAKSRHDCVAQFQVLNIFLLENTLFSSEEPRTKLYNSIFFHLLCIYHYDNVVYGPGSDVYNHKSSWTMNKVIATHMQYYSISNRWQSPDRIVDYLILIQWHTFFMWMAG